MGGSEDDEDSDDSNSSPYDDSSITSKQCPSNQFPSNQGFIPTAFPETSNHFTTPQYPDQPPLPPFPQLISAHKQEVAPAQVQTNTQQVPAQVPVQVPNQMLIQDANSPYRFVPNPRAAPQPPLLTSPPKLPATFHQTAWAVIPAQHFAATANIYSQTPQSGVAAIQAVAQNAGGLGGYHAEREFFGDKYVIQPYSRPEYTGGLQPIHYATDDDGLARH